MALLTDVFSRLLSMALMALPVMAVVLLVRLALSRAPRKYSYLLWLAVGFRLVCPISLDSLWSIFQLPGLYDLAESTGAVGTGAVDVLPQVEATTAPVLPAVNAWDGAASGVSGGAGTALPTVLEATGLTQGEFLLRAAAVLWLLGVIALLAAGIVSLVRLRRRLAGAVSVGDGVWESDAVPTPFVLGFLQPRIYLPPNLAGTERTCVLVHERCHIRRGDPWWKLLGWCVLAAYWWNPAVWLCWVLFCRDMEMSCDEAVLRSLGSQTKTGYSEALVSFALARRVPAALAFGEHDAARRVRHVLNWKKETPRIAFLGIAAVALAVVVCVSNPSLRPSSGDVWGVEGEEAAAWSLEYRFPKDTHAFVFYMEVYRYGELEDRACLVMDGMAADGAGVTKREGTFPLELFREDGRTGVRFSSGTFPTLLPEASDSALLTEWSYLRGKADLNLGGSAAVAVAWAPGEGTPSIDCGELNRQEPAALLRQCPVAVVLRLTVSRQGVDSLCQRIESGAIDLPAVLYGLRLDRALEGDPPTLPLQETLDQDLTGVRTILETLGVPDLENCTLELGIDPIGSGKGRGTLRVYCKAPVDSAAFADAMTTAGLVVPALVGEVDQVMYGYMRGGGKAWFTPYSRGGPNDLDEMAQELGYRDIHAVGKTLAGVQALADDTWAENLPGLSAADTLAQRLWTARDGTGTELETLLLNEGIPSVDGEPSWVPVNHRGIARTDEHTLTFRFDDPSATAQAVQQAMEKKAVMLLALRNDLTEVTWTWTPVSGEGISEALTEAEADALLAAAGFSEGVKAMGASPTALAQLLLWLESWTAPPTARELCDLAQASTPEAVAEEVVCRGPWADAYLEGTFTVSREGARLLLQFTREDAWERAVSMNRLASDGCLLLALYPELRGVRALSPDQQSYLWVTDQTAGQSLPEGTAIGDYGASPEALDDLVALLAANAPAAIGAEPFQDILGYDGARVTSRSSYGWSHRMYYAVAADGSHTAIALSFGWGEPEDYAVDLDGDGTEELVCNVAFGEEAVRRAYVYQRRPDGIYRGTPSPEGLEGFVDSEDDAYWSQYDPAENRIRLHYRVAGAQEYAVVTYEGMGGLTFEPFQG